MTDNFTIPMPIVPSTTGSQDFILTFAALHQETSQLATREDASVQCNITHAEPATTTGRTEESSRSALQQLATNPDYPIIHSCKAIFAGDSELGVVLEQVCGAIERSDVCSETL